MIARISVVIRGAVQGVGFRPFIFRLASSMNLNGFVLNSPQGVFIEVEGEKFALENFIIRIGNEKPVIQLSKVWSSPTLTQQALTNLRSERAEKTGKLQPLYFPILPSAKNASKK